MLWPASCIILLFCCVGETERLCKCRFEARMGCEIVAEEGIERQMFQ
jgi:hypothetical protein